MKLTQLHKIITESKCPGYLTKGDGSKCQSQQAYLGAGTSEPECPEKECQFHTTQQEKDIYPDRSDSGYSGDYPKTVEFAQAVADDDARLSYAALAVAAIVLGEIHSKPNALAALGGAAQLGKKLAQLLPKDLQDYICQRSGHSHLPMTSTRRILDHLPIIREEQVLEAIKAWQKHPGFRIPFGVHP